jgi:hypothetical protein
MRIGTGHVIREVGFVHNCACPGPGPWSQSDSRTPLLPRPDVRLRAHVGGERGLSSARGRRPKHCDGNPSHPAGRESNNLPPGPTRSPSEGSNICGGGRPFLCRAIADLRCCSGNHLREPPCKLSQASRGISEHGFRRSSAWNRVCELDLLWAVFALQARGHWFEPSCAHQVFPARWPF